MAPRNEELLLAELRRISTATLENIAHRVDELESRERTRDAEFNFFRGKQVAFATIFGVLGGCVWQLALHFLK